MKMIKKWSEDDQADLDKSDSRPCFAFLENQNYWSLTR